MALPSKRHSGGSVSNWSSLKSLHQIPAREMALHHPVPKDDIIRKTANAPRPIRPRSVMKNRVCSIVGRIKNSQWCFKLGCICSVPAGCTGAVAPLSYLVIRSTQSRFRPFSSRKNYKSTCLGTVHSTVRLSPILPISPILPVLLALLPLGRGLYSRTISFEIPLEKLQVEK